MLCPRRALHLVLVAGFATTAQAQTLFVKNSGTCTISGNCIQSDNYGTSNYANGGSPADTVCDISINNNWDMSVTAFDVQAGTGGGVPCDLDKVQVGDGMTTDSYCNVDNTLFPGGTLVMSHLTCGSGNGAPACQFNFIVNNDGTQKAGWKFCQTSPPKPPPPLAPFPPSLPPSPAPPGIMCENTCLDKDNKPNANTRQMVRDNYCSDGGKTDTQYDANALKKWGGSSQLEWSYGCKLGTDCADCGARSVCSTCAQTCQDRSAALGHKHTCWGDMYKNGACDVECNNWECGHDDGDCTDDEVVTQCILGHKSKALTSKPAQVTGATVMGSNDTTKLADVELIVESVDPILLNLQEATNSWVLSLAFQLNMRWRDTRVKTMACQTQLANMLSIENIEPDAARLTKSSYNSLVWQPMLMIEGNGVTFVPDSVTKVRSITEQKFAHWPGTTNGRNFARPTRDGATACTDCVGLNTTIALDVQQHPALKFGQFPFDIQVFRFSISAAGANIFNCETLFEDSPSVNISSLVPLSGEWNAWKLESVPQFFGNDTAVGDAPKPLTMKCDVRLTAQRNYIIFTIKQLFPSIIVVYTGLLSMYLSAADNTGDRVAAIMVSILILMVNFQSDLGIGKITYLVWWDVFNLVSMGVLALVLLECLYEHMLITSDKEGKCLVVNQVLRVAFIAFVYPCVLIWLLLYGLQGPATPIGWIILLGGNILTLLGSAFFYRKLSRSNAKDRDEVVAKLQSARLSNTEEMEAALTDAFVTFDLDNSGRLDIDEVRDLLTNLFKYRIVDGSDVTGSIDADGDGQISKYEFADLLLSVKKFADGNGTFSLSMLMEALSYATRENTHAERHGHSSVSTTASRAGGAKPASSPVTAVDVKLNA